MEYEPRLRKKYREEIAGKLMKELGYTSNMQIPRLTKISLNQGVGRATEDKKLVDVAQEELTKITGQKAVQVEAKKSISNFKLREGVPIGVRVTLRGDRMWEFLDRFISVSLPRVRDFRGLSKKSFDGRGNYTVGIKEQIIFTEIDIDQVTSISGMDITLVTTAKTDDEARTLLTELGMPFKKDEK